MKRRLVLGLLIMLALSSALFSGCKKNAQTAVSSQESKEESVGVVAQAAAQEVAPVPDDKIIINEISNDGNIRLGMPRQTVVSILDELAAEITDVLEITTDRSDWDYGHEIMFAGNFSFTFDDEKKLYDISTYRASTLSDLNIGDEIDRVVKIYGQDYRRFSTEHYIVLEYDLSGHYFQVYIRDNQVEQWAVTLFPFTKT